MRYILVIILVAVRILFGCPELFAQDSHYLLRALTYSGVHANWWHLAANAVALWSIYAPSRRRKGRDFAWSYIIAVLVYPLSFRPVVGISNILYATLGLRSQPLSNASWWKQPAVITFIVVTFAMLLVPSLSSTTHIAAFICGMLVASARRGANRLLKDARRYY